jgi:hypothetical protein
MTTNVNDNKAAARGTELDVQLALKGLVASPPQQTTYVIGTVSYTLADLTAKLQAMAGPYQDRRDLEQQLANARALVAQNAQSNVKFMRDLRQCFRGMLGSQNQQLHAYGIKPLKDPRRLTAEQRTLAVARGMATRKKRGTLGRKQKAAIRADAPDSVNVVRDVPAETAAPPQAPPATNK